MKKSIRSILSAALCTVLIGGTALAMPAVMTGDDTSGISVYAAAAETPVSSFTYTVNADGGMTITGFTGSQTDVVVPSKINNIPVNTIGTNAFNKKNKITSITLPNTLKYIGDVAFSECENLKKVNIPDSVTAIDRYAFYWCPNLKSVTVPASVKTIGMYAFGYYKVGYPSHVWVDDFTLYCTKGSAAENYAKEYSVHYSYISAVLPKSVSLSASQMSLGKGETTKLTATVSPSNATDKSVKWRTSDSKVLTVDQSGNVKAVNNGTAWITVRTSNGLEKSCKIIVKNAPSKITLTKGILTIGVGESYTIGSGINDGAACAKRTYRTSNSQIVKMTRTDWNGVFVGVKPGVAYVTVRTYNGKESTCKVTVKAAPAKVSLNKTALTLKVGQSASLSAIIPDNAGCAERTFRTSDSSVVKMTKTNWTGEFKALKKGVAYVTVRTYNGKEASCKVTVTDNASQGSTFILNTSTKCYHTNPDCRAAKAILSKNKEVKVTTAAELISEGYSPCGICAKR